MNRSNSNNSIQIVSNNQISDPYQIKDDKDRTNSLPIDCIENSLNDTNENGILRKKAKTDRDENIINRKDIKFESKSNIAENVCIMCCSNGPDAVLMPCSHGGICYECCLKISKVNPICPYCRKVLIIL